MFSFASVARAETCPPVLKADAKAYQALKVAAISQKGEVSDKISGFSLDSHKNKVTVVRLFATWCPYCKKDLQELNSKFTPLMKDKKLDVVLVSFFSRRENPETIELFMKNGAKELGVEKENFTWLHSNLKTPDVKALEAKKGEKLFPGMEGVPYGMVFDGKGRLRFQGHFTGEEAVQAKHYEMIESLASGKCS